MKNYTTQLEFWKDNPYAYITERLGVKPETLDWTLYPEYKNHNWDGTPNPIMAMINLLSKSKWVRVRSGVSTNKTFTAACLVLWFLECFPGSYVITTAPKKDQLHSQVWSEISKLYTQFKKGTLLTGELRMEDKTDTKWKAEAFVAGTKTTKESEEKAQGFHAEHMLIIIEETPGMPLPVLNALINTSTGYHNLILALGNPNSKIDNFRAFDKLSNVVDIRISGLDHPNVVLDDETIPGAQTTAGIKRLKEKFTEAHPMYQSRARGITPDSSIDALIKAEWIDEAVKRYNELCDDGILNQDKVIEYNIKHKIDNAEGLGADVANSEAGDKAAICRGKGYVCYRVNDFACPDSNELGDQIFRKMRDEFIDQRYVGVDGVGVGAGTVNQLKKYGVMESEVNIQGGAAPIDIAEDEELYINLRSQMWWKAREDFRLGRLAIPNDEELIADLLTPKWKSTKEKKIQVQSKEEIKKQLGHSPNKGDAFVYWNWKKHATPQGCASVEEEPEETKQKSLTSRIGIK